MNRHSFLRHRQQWVSRWFQLQQRWRREVGCCGTVSGACGPCCRRQQEGEEIGGDRRVLQLRHFVLILYKFKIFYVIDMDDECHMQNVFWADVRSRVAYESFGDVISFDNTI
uniref:Protein FAR1-RELATED SEQUENCE n=1 Tax=Lactuca sativa TaxID=4236 RepID=A0A9R1XVF5_LACSA|nr:hypothetical protein LSAT_V11C100010220 [Lactuca sativa]